MNKEILNLGISALITLAYMVGSLKVVGSFLKQFSSPMTHAAGLLYSGGIFGFGITLYNFSEIASGAFMYNALQEKVLIGLSYWLGFSLASFIFSLVIFRLSFYIVNISTDENEKAELAKNNYTLATVHAIVFIVVCLVVSQPLTDIGNLFVNYPKYPS